MDETLVWFPCMSIYKTRKAIDDDTPYICAHASAYIYVCVRVVAASPRDSPSKQLQRVPTNMWLHKFATSHRGIIETHVQFRNGRHQKYRRLNQKMLQADNSVSKCTGSSRAMNGYTRMAWLHSKPHALQFLIVKCWQALHGPPPHYGSGCGLSVYVPVASLRVGLPWLARFWHWLGYGSSDVFIFLATREAEVIKPRAENQGRGACTMVAGVSAAGMPMVVCFT